MKIRTDFVTNSSSSSFVVTFDKIPTTKEELKEMLFGNEEHYLGHYSDRVLSTDMVTETVFDDMKNGPASLINIMEELSESEIDGCPDYYDYKDNNAYEFAATVFMTEYIQRNNIDISKMFIFEYGDDDGDYYAALENGPLFNNLKHTKISHH